MHIRVEMILMILLTAFTREKNVFDIKASTEFGVSYVLFPFLFLLSLGTKDVSHQGRPYRS